MVRTNAGVLLALIFFSFTALGTRAQTPAIDKSTYVGQLRAFHIETANLPESRQVRILADMVDGEDARRSLAIKLSVLLDTGDYDTLDALFSEWNDPKQQFRDGGNRSYTFISIFDIAYPDSPRDEQFEAIQKWRRHNPKLPGAAIAEAKYWMQSAWDARGPGTSDTVTVEGWRLFQERNSRAEQILAESKGYAASSPLWYVLSLEVARDLGWEPKKTLALFNEAVSVHKDNYSIYHAMANMMAPMWGGDHEKVDEVIQLAARNTRAQYGEAMYTRLYMFVGGLGNGDFNLFQDAHASWKRMKQGFADLQKLYPDSVTIRNLYAAYACYAEDRVAYKAIRPRIGKDLMTDLWWLPDINPEVCDRKYLGRT